MEAPVPPPPPAPSNDTTPYAAPTAPEVAPVYGAPPAYGAPPTYGATLGYGTTPAYGAAPGYAATHAYGAAPGYAEAQPYTGAPAYGSYRPSNVLAWVSLGLAVGAILVGTLASIAAVICGHIARRQIRETGQQGDGLAIWGLVVGYLGIAFSVLIIVFFLVVFAGFGIVSTVPDSI